MAESRLLDIDPSSQVEVRSLTALPTSIREQLSGVSDAGGPFSAGCTGDHHRRFLAAVKTGKTYTVAIEQGGFLYTWFMTRFELDESGRVVATTRIDP